MNCTKCARMCIYHDFFYITHSVKGGKEIFTCKHISEPKLVAVRRLTPRKNIND